MSKLKPHSFARRQPPLPHFADAADSSTKSYNIKISRLSTQGAHRNVLLLYSAMLKSNIPPDPFTFPNLLKACTSLNLLSHGLSIHQHVVTNGYSNDEFISSSLINFYAKFGHAGDARNVFDFMPERNVLPWTAIIGCYSRLGYVDTAFLLYRMMRCDEIKPSSVTIMALLCGVSEEVHVQSLHACIIRYGFECDMALANCMLNSYGKYRRVEDAWNMFGLMCIRDIVSWKSWVSGYALVGNTREIIYLLYQIRVEVFEPDQQTFGSLLSPTARCFNLKIGELV